MSDFGSVSGGGTPPRAPSVTPSEQEREKERNDARDAAEAEQRQIDIAAANERGWVATTVVDLTHQNAAGEWYGSSGKYEWDDDYGEVAPDIPELEAILFGSEQQPRKGDYMQTLIEAKVSINGPFQIKPVNNFDDAGLHPVVLENVKRCMYEVPTPVQAYTIPALLSGHDVVAVALTGSGKTAAYLIPVLSKLMGKAKKLRGPRPSVNINSPGFDHRRHGVRAEPLVVIIVPTRELAIQVFDETRRMCYKSMLRPCVAYGGYPMGEQVKDLGKGCDILIATPGRVCDLMDKPEILTMSRIKYTIIDEADEMLDTDWSEELTKILQGGDSNDDVDHMYLLFSATFPKNARALARELMDENHFHIRIGRPGQSHKNIEQIIIKMDPDNKKQAVYDYLMALDTPGRTLIFCNSRPAVDAMDDFLFNKGLPTTSIHAGRDQTTREDAIRAFRAGRCPIMVATNIACRGWDVANIEHVINVDLPQMDHGGISEYVHRIGRTGRIGHKGKALSFFTDRDEDLGQGLVNTLIECGSEVPDFLSHLQPEEGVEIDFEDDSDEEEAEGEAEGGAPVDDAW